MIQSTLETLCVMGQTSDDDSDYIDIEIPKSQRPTRRKIGTARNFKRYSLSQPEPAATRGSKRKCKSPEPDCEDDSTPVTVDVNAIMKLLTKMSRDVKDLKSLINKEIPTIKSELEGIKSKISIVAPPINLENNLSALAEKVDQVSQKVNHATLNHPMVDISTKVEEVFDVQQKLNKRKMKFYDYLSYSERYSIYSSWEQLEPPFIMSKYLPGLIENEPPEEYDARRRKTENNRICDMELLSLRAQRAKSSLDSIDEEVAKAISDYQADDELKLRISNHWDKLVKEEEDKSRKIWEKTAKNLLDTPKREAETNRIVESNGKTYASVLKNSKKKKDDKAEEMQVDIPEEGEANDKQQWTTANAKNSRSHTPSQKKKTQGTPQTVKYKPSADDASARPSSFQKRGPKFKPKTQGHWYHRQNRWEYPRYQQEWW